jgi:hypothetical protein
MDRREIFKHSMLAFGAGLAGLTPGFGLAQEKNDVQPAKLDMLLGQEGVGNPREAHAYAMGMQAFLYGFPTGLHGQPELQLCQRPYRATSPPECLDQSQGLCRYIELPQWRIVQYRYGLCRRIRRLAQRSGGNEYQGPRRDTTSRCSCRTSTPITLPTSASAPGGPIIWQLPAGPAGLERRYPHGQVRPRNAVRTKVAVCAGASAH